VEEFLGLFQKFDVLSTFEDMIADHHDDEFSALIRSIVYAVSN